MTEQDVSLSEVTGTLSNKGYNLIRKLGEGTYAKVYLATFIPTATGPTSAPAPAPVPARKTMLACKVVDTAKAPKDFVRKFLPRELDILMKLNHPHIVHVHSIFQRRSKYYIFMRLAEKGDLLDWVLRHGAVPEGQSRVWLRQLALALQYLQVLDIAHRDLKCENVLITANYNVKLADFGFARYVVDARGRPVLSGTNCGSLSYAAPEILRGEHYDPRISDIWSLGVVLFIMLNKAMPFDDSNINRLYDEQIHRRWKFCSNVVDLLSEQVKRLILNLLEPETQRRYHVDQILRSEWLAMDPRLAASSPAEALAISTAQQERDHRYGRRDDLLPVVPTIGTLPAPAQTASGVGVSIGEPDSAGYAHGTSQMTNIASVELPEDPSSPTIPRNKEDFSMATVNVSSASNIPEMKVSPPRTQPSHGAISIMESDPLPPPEPPEFIPPDLSKKLTCSIISKMVPLESSKVSKPEPEDITEGPREKDSNGENNRGDELDQEVLSTLSLTDTLGTLTELMTEPQESIVPEAQAETLREAKSDIPSASHEETLVEAQTEPPNQAQTEPPKRTQTELSIQPATELPRRTKTEMQLPSTQASAKAPAVTKGE